MTRGLLGRKLHAWRVSRRSDVLLKTDGAGWVLDEYAGHIARRLGGGLRAGVVSDLSWSRGALVHIVDGSCFYDGRWLRSRHGSGRVIGTWWHGTPDSAVPAVREAARRIGEVSRHLACVHVACGITRAIVRQAGVPEEKIALIPQGVDLDRFRPPSAAERAAARRELGLAETVKAIGLFQKDGDGWGAGDTPKLIKGPDIFVKVMTQLARRHAVHAIVPGPARGFVVRALTEAGVPCSNPGQVSGSELVRYYHACDLYVVPGREEGGPAAVLESLATATPLVAHRVGMAPDVIEDGRNGALVDTGDIDALADRADRILSDAGLREKFRDEGLRTVGAYAWDLVARRYDALYRRVLVSGVA